MLMNTLLRLLKSDGPCSFPGSPMGNTRSQVTLPLAHTIEHEELLEVVKLEGVIHCAEDLIMSRDMFLLQLCGGMDENAVATCAELIFAPVDPSFADDAPLLPSGFRFIFLDSGKETSSPNRTLEVGSAVNKGFGEYNIANGTTRSVMTIAFEFACESHMQETVASMARQYVCSVISSVQRVALAPSPSHLNVNGSILPLLGTPEADTLAQWVCYSYRCYLGSELVETAGDGSDTILRFLWHHPEAVLCCSIKAKPVFTFANQSGLDMLETTLVSLQDITLEKIFDDNGRVSLSSQLPQIMQQGFACLQGAK